MTWIFGSFLVTPCALASCHILISKQEDDSASGHLVEQVCNRKETTWWEPRRQIWTECWESQSSEGHAANQRRLRRACKGVQALARVQSRSTPSFWTFGLAPSPAATPRVSHRPPDCTRGSPHSSAHPGTLWCWLSSRPRRCEVAWCGSHLKPHQRP